MLFHLCGNVARYYGLATLAMGLFYRPLLWLSLSCFLYPALHLYFKRRPPLNFPVFASLHWLELAAHQVGMAGRCIQCRTIRPLVPGLRF